MSVPLKNQTAWLEKARPIITKLTFYTVFLLVFLLSGVLSLIPGIPYRMGLVSFLVLPLLAISPFRLDKVFWGFTALVAAIALSALVNGSSLLEFLVFLRIPAFAFLVYFLADAYLNKETAPGVFKLLLFIGYLQLPIVIAQYFTYDHMPAMVKDQVTSTDFLFGTFNLKGDSSMSTFLVMMVVPLLFSSRVQAIVRYPLISSLYFSATVLLSNSRVSHIILVMVWLIYIARSIKMVGLRASLPPMLACLAFLGAFLYVDLIGGKVFNVLSINIVQLFPVAEAPLQELVDESVFAAQEDPRQDPFNGQENSGQDPVELYLTGEYARGGAIRYFLSQGVSIFGDGPTKYYNPITRERLRGNRGHFLTFYSEVGLLGWGASIAVFLLMVLVPDKRGRPTLRWVGVLLFAVLMMMSLTLEIMNDISVVFAYVLISRYYLLPDPPATAEDSVAI